MFNPNDKPGVIQDHLERAGGAPEAAGDAEQVAEAGEAVVGEISERGEQNSDDPVAEPSGCKSEERGVEPVQNNLQRLRRAALPAGVAETNVTQLVQNDAGAETAVQRQQRGEGEALLHAAAGSHAVAKVRRVEERAAPEEAAGNEEHAV